MRIETDSLVPKNTTWYVYLEDPVGLSGEIARVVDLRVGGLLARNVWLLYFAYVIAIKLALSAAWLFVTGIYGWVTSTSVNSSLYYLAMQPPGWRALVYPIILSIGSDVGLDSMIRQIPKRALLRKRGWPPMILSERQLLLGATLWNAVPDYQEWIVTPHGVPGVRELSPAQSLDAYFRFQIDKHYEWEIA